MEIKDDDFVRNYLKTSENTSQISEEQVTEIIYSELRKLRCTAILAIHNSTKRNSAILTRERLNHIERYVEDTDNGFKMRVLGILGLGNEGTVDHKKIFVEYLKQLDLDDHAKKSMDYIYDQSRDERRCQNLFNNETINKISNLLKRNTLDEEIKVTACETINNYLSLNSSDGLDEQQLRNYIHFLNNSQYSEDTIAQALKSIFLTVEKNKGLPDFMIEILTKIINKGKSKLDNFCMLIINVHSKQNVIKNIDEFSVTLLEDWVLVRDDHDISFEHSSQDNHGCQFMSSIVAEIFVNSLQRNIEISDKSIENLVKAFNSNDKQTCILSAKALYLVSQNRIIKNDVLLTLQEYVNSSISDVAIYSTVAYVGGLERLSSAKIPILNSHIDFLSNVYAFEELQLEQENFTDSVNQSVLIVLSNEAEYHLFEKNIIKIFDDIILFEKNYVEEVIEILIKYSAKGYSIEESTIFALENVASISQWSMKVLKLLENIVYNNGVISEKLLHIVADNFYLLDNDEQRKQSFDILDKTNDNQDISDELFDKLELERTSRAIGESLSNTSNAITYLCERTKEGNKVTISIFRALSNLDLGSSSISSENIFSVLLNVSKNRQRIPDNLINKLVNIFNPKLEQSALISYLIEIFENIVKNNQDVSQGLSEKLTQALENPAISDQVLFIFLLQGQRGENLPEGIIRKIIEKFLSIKNPLAMYQYLPFICSIIEKEIYFKRHRQVLSQHTDRNTLNISVVSLVQKALVHALKTDNQEVIFKSISGLKTLISHGQIELDKETIDLLLRIVTDLVLDGSLKEDIVELLGHCKLEGNQKYKYDSIVWVRYTDAELLDALTELEKPTLFKQLFDRINSIINNNKDLQPQALRVLRKCSNKKSIPDELLESIAVLLDSTNSERIKSLCCELISEMAQAGRVVTDKIISLIVDQNQEKKPINILKLISKTQSIPNQLQDKIQLSLHIDLMTGTNREILDTLLRNMRKEFQENKKFSNRSIDQLLTYKISEEYIQHNGELEQELTDIYALILKDNSDDRFNPFIDGLEKGILSKSITKNILDTYKEIIKRTQCKTTNFSRVINMFNNILNENNYLEFHFDIFVCIALASEFTQILELKQLENNLFNEDDKFRSWAFRDLRVAVEKGSSSSVFDKWCADIINKLEEETQLEINIDFDLFETIASSKFNDFNKIRNKPKNQWNREILILDLIERFQLNEGEYSTLYVEWFGIERCNEYTSGINTIILQMLHRFLLNNPISFDEFCQAIKLLKDVSFEDGQKILSNSKNLLDLKKEYLTTMIRQRLDNRNNIAPQYIEKLYSDIMSKFDFDLSQKMLHALECIDSLTDFKDLLKFAETNNIKIPDIYVEKRTIKIFRRSLEIKVLGNYIKDIDRFKLGTILDKLLDQSWLFEQLTVLFKAFKESIHQNETKYFVHVLEILSNYKISSTNKEKILLALQDHKPEDWSTEINKIAIKINCSDKVREKNSQELVDEFITQNSRNDHLKLFSRETLLKWIREIKDHSLTSRIFHEEDVSRSVRLKKKSIHEWNENDICLWAKLVKNNVSRTNKENFIIETLAVIKRANLLHTGFYLTDTQILSCLIALNSNNEKGRLLQVATGEGKSTIISVLAVFYVLMGKKVDIITSSPVLAERDAKEKAKFYKMFGVGCSHNNDKVIYLSGPKVCYKEDIVYGEVAQFQFDTLRTEYAQLNTLGDRKCHVAIVDEVDSMLIDDSSKIARLSTTISGMDQLQIIYHLLWNHLSLLQNKIIQIDGQMFLFYGKTVIGKDQIILEYGDDDGNIMRIENLKDYIASTKDIGHIGFRIPNDDGGEKIIKNSLDKYFSSFIMQNIKIPKHLENFVDKQISKWIDNAITALIYQENVQYIVHEGLIKPVDYNSTGVVQKSSNWSDGLHQFLQLKHNLKMTSETLTTNFLSNVGYFKRYGSNLFGLTGTLGSKKAKEVLQKVYNLDLALIPSLRQKQHLIFPDILVDNESHWVKEIRDSAILEAKKKRGTLIICETIEHCKIIEEELQHKYRSSPIKVYTMNDMNQEQNVEVIHPGEIIIATNLAGRGTDIKTDKIEEHGGLHVIVSFMPMNQRVEEQAFGRTSRQGKRGTSQKILNAVHLIHYGSFNIEEITKLRDENEAKILDEFEQNELKVINLKDNLFSKFCSLLNEIRMKIRKKTNFFTDKKNAIKSVVVNVKPSAIESNTLLSIEEQWVMFLRKIDDENSPIDIETIHAQFDKFAKRIRDDYDKECVIENPYYHIIIGNDLVINDSSLNSKYNEAMKHFNRAIDLDSDQCAAAFVGKGWLLLKGKERIIVSNEQELSYKDLAIIQFQRAGDILSEEISRLTSIQTLLFNRCSDTQTPLYKQLIQKSSILVTYRNNIENLISIIRKSQRLIQIEETIHYSNQNESRTDICMLEETISYEDVEKDIGKFCEIRLLSSDSDNFDVTAVRECKEIIIKKDQEEFIVIFKETAKDQLSEWRVNNSKLQKCLSSLCYNDNILDKGKHSEIYNQIYQNVTYHKGCIRGKFVATFKNESNGRKYEVTFNDLTFRKDTKTIDQAIDTINAAVKELSNTSSLRFPNRKHFLKTDYQQISVSLLDINSDTLKQLFNPNIEVKHVAKKIALAHLKDKSSFFHRHVLPENFRPDSYQVDLDIIHDNNIVEGKKGIQVREAIEIIKNTTENNAYFNISFLSANDIFKGIKEEVINCSRITAEFIEINGQDVANKVAQITSESINLVIFDKKEEILKVIQSVDKSKIELYSSRRKKQKFEDKTHAEKVIQNSSEKTAAIRLIGVNPKYIKTIIDICREGTFNISFIRIDTQSVLNGIDEKSMNIYFDKLEEETAEFLIQQIRKTNANMSLTFKDLDQNQARKIIEKAPINTENIQINKTKSLREIFMNELRPDLELSEFFGRGIEYLLEISEKNFIPWISISIVAGIAAVQMAVGGALVATAFGASVGMGLITEGAADFFFAHRTYSTRQFSWSDYGKQKAISLTISAASMGISAIKDAGKGVKTIFTATTEEVLEQTGTYAIKNNRAAQKLLIKTGKNLKSLAMKQIGVTIGENVLREGLIELSNVGTHFVFEQMKMQISNSIQEKVINKFFNSHLMTIIRKMFALDRRNKNQIFEEKINRIITGMINQKRNLWRKQLVSIGGHLCRGILSDTNKLRTPASLILRIVSTLNGTYELCVIIEETHQQLLDKLIEIDKETLSMERIFCSYCSFSDESSQDMVNVLASNGIVELNKELASKDLLHKLDNINIDGFSDDQLEMSDFSKMMKLVSDIITDEVLKITESQLISPWSSYLMGEATKAISERVQHYFIVNERQNAPSQNQENEETEYNTIAKQIRANARDYIGTKC
ncbi:unnamed protein product [Rotaria sp. Silwood2]|nr:unnamed protein product [Rotaria sp. Silwood2]